MLVRLHQQDQCAWFWNFFVSAGVNSRKPESEADIHKELFANYNKFTRPVKDANTAVHVEVGLTLSQVVDLVCAPSFWPWKQTDSWSRKSLKEQLILMPTFISTAMMFPLFGKHIKTTRKILVWGDFLARCLCFRDPDSNFVPNFPHIMQKYQKKSLANF